MTTSVRLYALGRALSPDLVLPSDLEDNPLEHLGLVLLVRRGMSVVSLSTRIEVQGYATEASPERVTTTPRTG